VSRRGISCRWSGRKVSAFASFALFVLEHFEGSEFRKYRAVLRAIGSFLGTDESVEGSYLAGDATEIETPGLGQDLSVSADSGHFAEEIQGTVIGNKGEICSLGKRVFIKRRRLNIIWHVSQAGVKSPNRLYDLFVIFRRAFVADVEVVCSESRPLHDGSVGSDDYEICPAIDKGFKKSLYADHEVAS